MVVLYILPNQFLNQESGTELSEVLPVLSDWCKHLSMKICDTCSFGKSPPTATSMLEYILMLFKWGRPILLAMSSPACHLSFSSPLVFFRDPGWRNEESHPQRSRTGSESSQQGSSSRGKTPGGTCFCFLIKSLHWQLLQVIVCAVFVSSFST